VKRLSLIAHVTLVMLLGGISYAHGQKSTERFIPIGQSPGISGKYSVIGTIEAVDPSARTLAVRGWPGLRVSVTQRTHIWIDRSAMKLPSLPGAFTDLQSGRRVEVKFEDSATKTAAEWVKVEAAAP
jgi:hypothetical protein